MGEIDRLDGLDALQLVNGQGVDVNGQGVAIDAAATKGSLTPPDATQLPK